MGNYLQDQAMQIIIPLLQVDEYCVWCVELKFQVQRSIIIIPLLQVDEYCAWCVKLKFQVQRSISNYKS